MVKTVVVEAPAACPPIQERVSASLPGELTRITIPAGAIALSDPGNRAWCDTSQLKLAKASVMELVSANGCFTDRNDNSSPCSVYNALAAVDIQPGWVKFTSPSNVMLVYDLSKTENRPYCTGTGGDCGGYAIYQLKSSLPPAPALAWRYASPASPVSGSTPASAVGRIDRLSTLALVELPPPQLFPMVITSALTVDSEFIPDQPENPGAFSVAFLIRDDTLGMKDQTRLFRFSDPEMLAQRQRCLPGRMPGRRCLPQRCGAAYLPFPQRYGGDPGERRRGCRQPDQHRSGYRGIRSAVIRHSGGVLGCPAGLL